MLEAGTGGTNPIRGVDTQPGDDGEVESHANVNFQSFRKNIRKYLQMFIKFQGFNLKYTQ
jgi:hypothetical protein